VVNRLSRAWFSVSISVSHLSTDLQPYLLQASYVYGKPVIVVDYLYRKYTYVRLRATTHSTDTPTADRSDNSIFQQCDDKAESYFLFSFFFFSPIQTVCRPLEKIHETRHDCTYARRHNTIYVLRCEVHTRSGPETSSCGFPYLFSVSVVPRFLLHVAKRVPSF